MRESPSGARLPVDVDAIRRVLEELPVTLAVLYGSQARGEATTTSDVDLAVAFDDSLNSVERTRARLALIERLSAALDTDDVDVVPLGQATPELVREIVADGVLIAGTRADLDAYRDESPSTTTHEERVAALDAVLADLERVV